MRRALAGLLLVGLAARAQDAGSPPDAGQLAQPVLAAPAVAPGLTPERLAAIQAALVAAGIDGWLLTDFRRTDPIALHALGLEGAGHIATRRWFCLVPARGQPQKLVHAIEPNVLDAVPGATASYSSWRQRDRELGRMLHPLHTVALDYSPRNELPMVSRVDGGTVELIRSLGPEVVSSEGIVARVESTLDAAQLASQARAAELLSGDLDATAQEAVRRIRAGAPATERELQEFAQQRQLQEGFESGGGVVAADAHSALPHYSPPATGSAVVGPGSLLLLDFSSRLGGDPKNIHADLTRVYFLGPRTPDEIARVAGLVFKARDAAVELLRERAQFNKAVTGAEVDQAARKVIDAAGLGDRFLHRTGHSIGTRGHGDGVNNDDFETHDARKHLPNTCFSVEPGIYLAGRFGIRSEIDVCLVKDALGKLTVEVRGGPLQQAVPALIAQ